MTIDTLNSPVASPPLPSAEKFPSTPDQPVVALPPQSMDDTSSVVPRQANVRVLHVINGEHYSGAERVQDLLAARLPELGFDVGFACVKPGVFAKKRSFQSAPVFDIPMHSRIDLRAVKRLVQIIRRHDYRIVHAHTPRSALVGRIAARIVGVPLVYHVHSPARRDTTRGLRNWINAASERLTVSGAARLIAVSHSLGQHMAREKFQPERIVVVPNGVPRVGDLPPRRTPRGTWQLGTVALFRPRKGIEALLEALALLEARGLRVGLRAVGGFECPDYMRQTLNLAAKLGVSGRVQWTGFTSDVAAELARMDLFVLPSLFGEGLPMVVLEAMAAGVPVVASRVEGVPEAVRHGIDGVLAQPGDPAALAEAIAQVITGQYDWQDLRRSAIARHAERFSDRSMALGVAQAYRQVLAECSSAPSRHLTSD